MDAIDELLTRGVANIIPGKDELKKTLSSGKKLNIYFGIDPTSTKIHLGHTVPLRTLNRLAKLGHYVTFLIGDFTALIGDSSDKESERPILTSKQIEKNFQTYKKQAMKVLDFSNVKIRFNSEWLKKLNFEDIVKLCQHFSVGDFVGRELIKKRLSDGKRVGLHEFLYPVMQGYDSYFLDTDLQVGGTDQTFNMQAGRTLQKKLREKDTFVLSATLLVGSDGRKMSKSWGNVIWVEDSPNDMFAKTMAVDDDLIIPYFKLATNIPLPKILEFEEKLKNGENPINVKKELAIQIVKESYDEKMANLAKENFQKIVQNKENPQEIELCIFTKPKLSIMEILIDSKLISSNSEAKRLIEQGGVSIDEKTITNVNLNVDLAIEHLLKIGKKRFLRIIYR